MMLMMMALTTCKTEDYSPSQAEIIATSITERTECASFYLALQGTEKRGCNKKESTCSNNERFHSGEPN